MAAREGDEAAADLRAFGVPEAEIERVLGDEYLPEPPEWGGETAEDLRDFLELSPSRNVGFGVGPIPVSEIGAYWDRMGVEPFETFLRKMRVADNEYLNWVAKQK